jgi:hypothetical protein
VTDALQPAPTPAPVVAEDTSTNALPVSGPTLPSHIFALCTDCGRWEEHRADCRAFQGADCSSQSEKRPAESEILATKSHACLHCRVATDHRAYCSRATAVATPSTATHPNPRLSQSGPTAQRAPSTPSEHDAIKGWASLAFIALIIYGLAHACGGLGTSKFGAQDRCETYIKTLLKAPSTADFSGETATDNGDKTWNVTGNVDSENGFGASLRSTWSCTARDNGDGWSIVSGNVDG